MEEGVENLPVSREQQRALVVAENALILLQLLEKRIKLRIFALRLVANAVGLDIGLIAQDTRARFGVGLHLGDPPRSGTFDVFFPPFAIALVFGSLLAAFTANALKDGLAHRGRMIGAAQ